MGQTWCYISNGSGLVSWMKQEGVSAENLSETGVVNFVRKCISLCCPKNKDLYTLIYSCIYSFLLIYFINNWRIKNKIIPIGTPSKWKSLSITLNFDVRSYPLSFKMGLYIIVSYVWEDNVVSWIFLGMSPLYFKSASKLYTKKNR